MRKIITGLFALILLFGFTNDALLAQQPSLGGQIVYSADYRDGTGIFITPAANPAPRFVIMGTSPSLCPAGQRIVFVSGSSITCVLTSGGPTHTVVPHGLGVRVTATAPRPDSSGLVFAMAPVVPNPVWSVYTANNDGTGERRVVENGRDPSVSPDGQWIIFARDSEIYRVKTDGSNLTQLTKHGAGMTAYEPSYSPDGRKIIFYVTPDSAGTQPYIQVMNADGTGEMTVINNGAQPDYSPDGRWIVFLRGNDIMVVGLDGANPKTLVANVPGVARPIWGLMPAS